MADSSTDSSSSWSINPADAYQALIADSEEAPSPPVSAQAAYEALLGEDSDESIVSAPSPTNYPGTLGRESHPWTTADFHSYHDPEDYM